MAHDLTHINRTKYTKTKLLPHIPKRDRTQLESTWTYFPLPSHPANRTRLYRFQTTTTLITTFTPIEMTQPSPKHSILLPNSTFKNCLTKRMATIRSPAPSAVMWSAKRVLIQLQWRLTLWWNQTRSNSWRVSLSSAKPLRLDRLI